MKNLLRYVLPLCSAGGLILSSCSSAQKPLEDFANGTDTTMVQSSFAHVVGSESDLPKCAKDSLGKFYFVINDSSFRYCNGSTYLQYELASATNETTSCTIDTSGNQKSLNCSNGSSFVLKNGTNGADGQDGQNGTNGTSGTNGTNGQTGNTGANGSNGISCKLTDDGEGTISRICGTDTTSWPMAMCQITLSNGPALAKNTSAVFGVIGTIPYDPTTAYCSRGMLFKKCNDFNYPALFAFCDERDSSIYIYSAFGSQAWMNENLRFKSNNRYYTFSQLQESVCPDGWEVPNLSSFDTLQNYLIDQFGTGGDYNIDDYLKIGASWNNGSPQSGFPSFGAYASGYLDPDSVGTLENGMSAYYWTRESASADSAYALRIMDEGDTTPASLDSRTVMSKGYSMPVRCVRKMHPAEIKFWKQAYINLESFMGF